ncbi:MAG: hypothetical protein RBU21_01920 [FCB group bacterium]|jgi:hypothetical protein|nr:hypothetical protein [FCB group bacterium]
MEERIAAFCEKVFQPILQPVFLPIDRLLNKIPTDPWATVCAIALFITAMLVVGVVMKESYVNQGRTKKVWYTDLRLWTVVCMLPHVLVYFYFR